MAEQEHGTVHEVRNADPAKMMFDGQKADVYLNTSRLGGKHFLVKVSTPGSAQPTLIAIHL
jgi:hypothetical protein